LSGPGVSTRVVDWRLTEVQNRRDPTQFRPRLAGGRKALTSTLGKSGPLEGRADGANGGIRNTNISIDCARTQSAIINAVTVNLSRFEVACTFTRAMLHFLVSNIIHCQGYWCIDENGNACWITAMECSCVPLHELQTQH
jgi:hypothetical protein